MPRKFIKAAVKAASTPSLSPGEQIKAARLAKGWSQTELGSRLGGISRQRVQQIESWKPEGRPAWTWFLEHGEVWIELGLGLEFLAQVSRGERVDVCPTCHRPL